MYKKDKILLKSHQKQYRLKNLIIFLNQQSELKNIFFGNFTDQKKADLCLQDLNKMKNEGYISGSWRIARADNVSQEWNIAIKHYQIHKNLKKYLKQTYMKNCWEWVKLNYISILSVVAFLVLVTVAIIVIITAHIF